MDQVTDPRRNAPACPRPSCGARAGDPWCLTATGFPRGMHAARLALIRGEEPAAGKPAGALTGRRPSEAQQRILVQAAAAGGLYELSGYRFHGDAQRRAAMTAMADDARGWFREVRHTDHGTLFEITTAGRSAAYRYEDWMNGRPTR